MNLSDLNSMLEDFNKKVDDIVKSAENLGNMEIIIDDTTPPGKEKLEEIKKKLDRNSEELTARMNGMRNKVVKNLNSIYKKATKSIQPYKNIAEMAMAIAVPGANLGALATFASKVIDTLQAMANHYVEQYTEPLNTINAVMSAGMKLQASTSKLSNLPVPKITTKSGKTYIPKLPSVPSITIGDIISGGEVQEDPGEPIPKPKQQRQVAFTSFNELKEYPTTYLKTLDFAFIVWTHNEHFDDQGELRADIFTRDYLFDADKKWKPKGKANWVYKNKEELISLANLGEVNLSVGSSVLFNPSADDSTYGRCLDPTDLREITGIIRSNNVIIDIELTDPASDLKALVPNEPVMIDVTE